MQICVCGWWYFPEYYDALLEAVKRGYHTVVVKHRDGETNGLPFVNKDNIGLEWGAYSYYIDEIWDGESDVLFTQDDVKVKDASFFDWASKITEDVCSIFHNNADARYNGEAHGRMIFMSSRFLLGAQKLGGFWYDKGNHGFIAKGNYRSETPPPGSSHHNAGIHNFLKLVPRVRKESPEIKRRTFLCSPKIVLGRRGKL